MGGQSSYNMWAKTSKLDVVYRKLLLTKFFTKGWGSVEILKRICEFSKVISDRSLCKHLIDRNYPVFIDKNEKWGECRLIEGHFLSPFAKYMKGIMPKKVETARFQFLLPMDWNTERKPVCIHLAGTGDHGFWRRRTIMARPLLKEYGIASIILENPFYGLRKPKEQLRSSLLNVSDLFVMGGALILETLTLLHWCEKEGYGPLGVSGVSMGGHMASLAATNWHKPLALIPCLSWSNATPIFTQGVLSGAIPWKILASEYVFHSQYEAEILRKLMKCPHYDAFRLGQEFAVNFPDSMEELINVKLKSGFGSARHHQEGATSSEQCQETENYSSSIPYEPATSTSGLNQQSPQCNSANSERQSDAKTYESDAMYTQPDQCQSDSILGTNGFPNNSSSCQTNHSIDTKHSAQEANSTNVIADNQQVQNVSGHPCKGMHTQRTHNTTDLYVESSKVNAARQHVNQTHTESVESAGIHSQRIDTDKSSRNSQAEELRSSDEETGVKHDSSSRTISGSAHDKNSKNSNQKWKPSKEEYTKLKQDALHFMRGVMDTATFVGNFSKPVDPELVFAILANQDAYIPWQQMPNLAEMWPGMEVRYINSGHISAILFQQHHFRRAIKDAFQKMEKKYNGIYPEEL